MAIKINEKTVETALKQHLSALHNIRKERASSLSISNTKKIKRRISLASERLNKFRGIIQNIPAGFHLTTVKMPNNRSAPTKKTAKMHLRHEFLEDIAGDSLLHTPLKKMGINTEQHIKRMKQGRVPQTESGHNFDIAVTAKNHIGAAVANINHTSLDNLCIVPSWLCAVGRQLDDLQMDNPYLEKNGAMLAIAVSPNQKGAEATVPFVEGGFQPTRSLKERIKQHTGPQ